MYDTLVGKQRSLVFPVMCNAHIKLDYSDNIPDTGGDGDSADDIAYGIWAHSGSFTFEAVVTPYDINGYGTHSGLTARSFTASKKIMPALSQSVYTATNQNKYQSELYLTRTARLTHEMMIFYSDNFQVSLVNSTLHNENQPAQYKIRVRLKLGTTTDTIDTDVVIAPSSDVAWEFDTSLSSTLGNKVFTGINDKGRLTYDRISQVVSHSGTALVVRDNSLNLVGTDFFVGQEVFTAGTGFDFISIGTIAAKSGNNLTLTTSYPSELTGFLYLPIYKNPTYLNDAFHIACSYNDFSKKIDIFLNGTPIKTILHTQTDSFSFNKADYFLGANGTGATGDASAVTNKQFMGELHELAITALNKTQFSTLFNLIPNYDKTLLYLRFEEVDI
tara:strand:- start:14120 stop:15283 length:1164 start_codon:yes stop_codon:yes gene_type:complete